MIRNKDEIFSDMQELILDFIERKESVDEFYMKFVPLWREYRDAEESLISTESKQKLSKLTKQFFSGKITKEEYSQKSAGIEGIGKGTNPLIEPINSIHSAGSAYSPDPSSEWEINELQLREIIQAAAISLGINVQSLETQ